MLPSPLLSTSVNDNLVTNVILDHESIPNTFKIEEFELALNKEANTEELKKAISRCKELVLESDHCSVERKWLIRHLIELRLRLEEWKEIENDFLHPQNTSNSSLKIIIRGHHLIIQPLLRNTISKYCDHCTTAIWSVVQIWYKCEDCGYSCHYKCSSQIIRECAHVVASEKGSYELNICPEKGLSLQKYRCAECSVPLPISKDWSEGRLCDYTGLYYCRSCHWGSHAIIPARVIHNWDLTPQQVCQASLQLLRVTCNRPIINLEKINPHLFTFVKELNYVKRSRQELIGMKKYLSVCRIALDNHLIWKNVNIPHLIETIDLYSLQDLVDISTGDLLAKLHTIIDTFSQHIKVKCEICKGRGHICEICSNNEVLFPFDETAFICNKCNAVLHKNCYDKNKNSCPKCIRLLFKHV